MGKAKPKPKQDKHNNVEPSCSKCKEILTTAHPKLVTWFNEYVKPQFKDAHVSYAWRNEADQNRLFKEGASRAIWPNSKHNYMVNGEPKSLAIDLFRLNDDGSAKWEYKFFKSIYDLCVWELYDGDIGWGGNWRTFKDSPHYELYIDSKGNV